MNTRPQFWQRTSITFDDGTSKTVDIWWSTRYGGFVAVCEGQATNTYLTPWNALKAVKRGETPHATRLQPPPDRVAQVATDATRSAQRQDDDGTNATSTERSSVKE